MNYSPILIVAGEPNSIFLEIFFKAMKKSINKNPLILIASHKLVKLQMKKLNFKKKIKLLNYKKIDNYYFDNNSINLINVNLKVSRAFEKISGKKIPFNLKKRRAGDVDASYTDNRYALKILDWQSEHDITKMCEDTWRWQCQNPNGYI